MPDLLESARELLREAHREVKSTGAAGGPADVKLARYGGVLQTLGRALGMLRVDSQQDDVPEHKTYEKFAVDLLRYILIQTYWLYEHRRLAAVPPVWSSGSTAITRPGDSPLDQEVLLAHKSIDEAWQDFHG